MLKKTEVIATKSSNDSYETQSQKEQEALVQKVTFGRAAQILGETIEGMLLEIEFKVLKI